MHKIYLDGTEKALTRLLKRAKFAGPPSLYSDEYSVLCTRIRYVVASPAARQLPHKPSSLRQFARIFPLAARERTNFGESLPDIRFFSISIVRD